MNKPVLKKIFWAIFLLLIGYLYVFGAYVNAFKVNLNVNNYDQSAYLDFSKKIVKSHFTYTGVRDRMPLFPLILTPFYSPNLEVFFSRAKIFNIYLSLIFLIAIYISFRKYLSFMPSITLILIVAFTAFIFKAPYVQAEITYYTLFYFGFLFTVELIEKPTPKRAIMAGILLGLAQFTKASVCPFLIVFILVVLIKLGYQLLSRKKIHLANAFNLLIVVFLFLFINAPYMIESKQKYNNYFYNIEYYYTWLDSWKECVDLDKKLDLTKPYNTLSTDQLPGPLKYFQTHNLIDIFSRIIRGFIATTDTVAWRSVPYGYDLSFKVFLFLFLVFSILTFYKTKEVIKKHVWSACLIILNLAVYLLLISWHGVIAQTNRYILSLFLPIMFYLSRFIFKQFKIYEHHSGNKLSLNITRSFNYLLLTFIFIQIIFTITSKVYYLKGGN